ncbi:unnamed protein product [Vicia faba]|uniref:Uncharacterized protein n=1 Tax=Vicia faba TaxID=3906 RepID=A0AAV1AAY6_VICFA|nr:unnamed protein product [Vicia faba]
MRNPNIQKEELVSKGRKYYYLSIIQDFTKTKDSTTQEISNVNRQCEELKVFNSKLKAKQKELNINGPKGEYKNPNLEINKPTKVNDFIKSSVNTSNTEQRIHLANNFEKVSDFETREK